MPKTRSKTPEEIKLIAEGGKILRSILQKTAGLVKPGVSSWELNEFAENEILKAGGRPSFKGYGPKDNPFPASLCTSINSVVVHGVPSKSEILKEGDIIGLDAGMEYKGLYTDSAITVPVGRITPKAAKLIETTKQALANAIKQVKPGNTIGHISYAIQKTAETNGFNVVRDLVGHGVGYGVHEEPSIPCFGQPGRGPKLEEGMVLAIEPMLVTGEFSLKFHQDGWTISAADGGLSGHFEHTVAVAKNGPNILT